MENETKFFLQILKKLPFLVFEILTMVMPAGTIHSLISPNIKHHEIGNYRKKTEWFQTKIDLTCNKCLNKKRVLHFCFCVCSYS